MLVHLCSQSSCSWALSSNIIIRAGGSLGGGKGEWIWHGSHWSLPPPRGLVEQHSPWPSLSSPSSPAAVRSLSELAALQGRWCGGGRPCSVFVRALVFLCHSFSFLILIFFLSCILYYILCSNTPPLIPPLSFLFLCSERVTWCVCACICVQFKQSKNNK